MNQTRYRSVAGNANGSIATGEAVLDVAWGRTSTLDPNTVFDFGPGAGGFGSADGGTPGGGDGEGAGVGGGLGKVKQARITIARVVDGAPLGTALAGANTGLVRVKAGPGAAPVLITMQGTPVASYYDEGRDTMLSFGADQELHALVLDFDRHLGVTMLTEAAYRYALNNFLQEAGQVRSGAVPLKRTATPEEIARLTKAQIQQANETIRNEINRVLPARYALPSISTLPTPVDNTSGRGAITDNIYGRMQVVVGGLALAAGRFNGSLGSPALTMNAQLADDLTDGVIDGLSLDGQSVFRAPGAAYDVAGLPALLEQTTDEQFARFGDGAVTLPPVITTQPQSALITSGRTATLSVAATGSLLDYQWFRDGQAIGGETQPTLETGVAGAYFVRVSNSVGTVNSATVIVTVTGTPPVAPPTITTQPASASVPSGDTHTFSVVAAGTNLRYQWFNTGGELTGATAATYSTGTAGGYYVVIRNEAGSVTSATATLTLTPRIVPPVITTQPTSVTINPGQTARLEVGATGNPLFFQWFSGSTPIAGATSSTLLTTAAGSYSVRVSNANGANAVTSNTVTVTVNAAPTITAQPQSVTITEGQTTTLSVTATGTAPLTYQWNRDGTPVGNATGRTYVTGQAGIYTVVVGNAVGSVTSAAATVTVNPPAPVAPTITTQPVSTTITQGQTASLSVVATGTAPLTYQWRRDGAAIPGATSASYGATLAGVYTVVVTNSVGSVTSAAATVTVNPAPPTITRQPASVTIALGETTTLSVVATGTAPLAYQWRRDGTAIQGATAATYTTDTAGSYTVVVSNAVSSVTSAAAVVTVIVPPTITTQPRGATINQGQTTTLSVVAAGTAPFTYQWINANGNIPGATSSSYVTGVAGSYAVVVTNAAGSATSTAAVVTVIVPPTITTQPQSVVVQQGQPATLSVVATGTTPTYQWQRQSGATAWGDVAGANVATFVTFNAGTYRVIVSNAAGTVTSASATVTFGTPPP
jgi:hypothetical protein